LCWFTAVVDLGSGRAAALPVSEARKISHKVVYPISEYVTLNQGLQAGKVITIDPDPILHSFTDLAGVLYTMFVEMKAKPVPRPADRLSGHLQPEHRTGVSGLITYVITEDCRK
jgi:hypothetical protein